MAHIEEIDDTPVPKKVVKKRSMSCYSLQLIKQY